MNNSLNMEQWPTFGCVLECYYRVTIYYIKQNMEIKFKSFIYKCKEFSKSVSQRLTTQVHLDAYPFPSYDNSVADHFEHILSKNKSL